MSILIVNTGSSSVKLALYTTQNPPQPIRSIKIEETVGAPAGAIKDLLSDGSQIDVVVHRVVHGGNLLVKPVLIDDRVESEIERLSPMAPLHNPVALSWIQACREVLGAYVPQLAVFDTAFFADMPEIASTYALPRGLRDEFDIHRYGFQGIAHQSMWLRWRELHPSGKDRVISVHLGAGCSIAANRAGRPLDTSMGFSPLEGLVMATRGGDLDPGILTYLQRVQEISLPEIENILNRASGLLGISDISSDMRELRGSSDPAAVLAIDIYCYRLRKYIGAYLAVMAGADAIIFGGGVGEHDPGIRQRALSRMEWCGLKIDLDANENAIGREAVISDDSSQIEVWVMVVNEAQMMAKEAMTLLSLKET